MAKGLGLGINEKRAVGREEGWGGVWDNFNDCRDNFLAVRRGEKFGAQIKIHWN